MSSIQAPKIRNYKAGGTINHGHAVKAGADDETVVECTANTDKPLGIAQVDKDIVTGNRAVLVGAKVEVAMPGGGAEVAVSETVLAGQHGVSHTDGSIRLPNALGDGLICSFNEGGVSGDFVDAMVIKGQAAAAE